MDFVLLGWYDNLLWLDRRKCVLLTHAGTLFPVFVADVRKRDFQPPGALLTARIEAALTDDGSRPDFSVRSTPRPSGSRDSEPQRPRLRERFGARVPLLDRAGRRLENTDLDDLNRFLRRQLHNRAGYRQPLDLVLDRVVS